MGHWPFLQYIVYINRVGYYINVRVLKVCKPIFKTNLSDGSINATILTQCYHEGMNVNEHKL